MAKYPSRQVKQCRVPIFWRYQLILSSSEQLGPSRPYLFKISALTAATDHVRRLSATDGWEAH